MVFAGTGTAGAYHAGVLRALHEAGIRVDVVAGSGIGAVSALFAAVDAGARLWDANGLWLGGAGPAGLYRWRPLWRLVGWCLVGALAALALPLALVLAASLVYLLAQVGHLVAPALGTVFSNAYDAVTRVLLAPELVYTIVPRVALVVVIGAGVTIGATLWRVRAGTRTRRRVRGGALWEALGAPMDGGAAVAWALGGFWRFVRGATNIAQPGPADLSRRYAELLADSLGQPGYRELIIAVHDLDARRDLVFALLAEPHRRAFGGDANAPGAQRRHAELVDLATVGRDHVVDALGGALSVPVVTEPHALAFSPESAWRGETHRVADRPGTVSRLLEEALWAGATQVVLVGATAELPGPHALGPRRLDPRARLGEYLASAETVAARDAAAAHAQRFAGLYEIRPAYNPLGPFDLAGGYDERSDRPFTLRELMGRGYEDAYRQFIEPVVGASGEGVGAPPVQSAADDLDLRPARDR